MGSEGKRLLKADISMAIYDQTSEMNSLMKKRHTRKFVGLLSFMMILLGCIEETQSNSPGTSSSGSAVKILALGNSITEGSSYRYRLWKKLVDAEFDHTFIGLRSEEDHGYPDYKGLQFTDKHQGVSGITALDVAEEAINGWLDQLFTPDVVLIHLGTNDAEVIFEEEATVEEVVNSIRSILQALRNKNAEVKIYLAQIIPLNTEFPVQNELVPVLNARYAELANELNTTNSPIVLVDCYTDFSSADLEDAWHPNETGSEKMARRFAEALLGAN